MSAPKILAFMQCMWLRDPEKHRRILASYDHDIPRREKLRRRMIAYALFAGCKSGRVLKCVFGAELCERIIWEEASREIGGESSAAFPADVDHILATILAEQPDCVIGFGKIACGGIEDALKRYPGLMSFVRAPHPAARHATVVAELDEAKFSLDYLLATA